MGRVPWAGRSVASYQILVEAEADGCCDGGLDEGDGEPLVEPLEEPLVPDKVRVRKCSKDGARVVKKVDCMPVNVE